MQIRVCRLQTGFPAADFISKFSNYLCGRINETTHHGVLSIKKKKIKKGNIKMMADNLYLALLTS